MFSPEMTLPRQTYQQAIDKRTDRQSDIPNALDVLQEKRVRLSKGGYHLSEGQSIDATAWQDLVTVVHENKKRSMQPFEVGLALLNATAQNAMHERRKALLAELYAYSVENGEQLPPFSIVFETLAKYKEFIGDRLNDLIATVLIAALQEKPEEYRKSAELLSDEGIGKGLFKTLAKLWLSSAPNKEEKIRNILARNNVPVEVELGWKQEWGAPEIGRWIVEKEHSVVQKGTVAKVKNALTGEDYRQMQEQMKKYHFKKDGRSFFVGGEEYTFTLSKRRAHSVAMFNMGVCVAVDDQLWNSPDMWQLIIFDKEDNGMGGAIYRSVEEDGKKYLIVSVQPSSKILNNVSASQVFDKIVQYSRLIKKLEKFDALLIPVSASIHSNRGSIQQEIANKRYPTIKLKTSYQFSYSPYSYSYDDFFEI